MSENVFKGVSIMQRSQNQIATSYAPGSLFTFEGGQGCFRSIAIPTETWPNYELSSIKPQIEESLKEFIQNWFSRAMNLGEVYPEQVLDNAFLSHHNQPSLNMKNFVLYKPSSVGYKPEPLVFVCKDCGDLKNIEHIEFFKSNFEKIANSKGCGGKKENRHTWQQMDVIFAHWSGEFEGLYPSYSNCSQCGVSDNFKLIRKNTGAFKDWSFSCKSCGHQKELTIPEIKTRELLLSKSEKVPPRKYNMLPVSYRASSVFYSQTDNFIVYSDTSFIDWLKPKSADANKLIEHLMTQYNYRGSMPSLDEIINGLKNGGEEGAVKSLKALRAVHSSDNHEDIENYINLNKSKWANKGVFDIGDSTPKALKRLVVRRLEFSRKYDPVRQSLEHYQLEKEYLSAGSMTSDSQSTDLTAPSPDIHPFKKMDQKKNYEKDARALFSSLGIQSARLINELQLCQYSFGYSRVGSSPSVDISGMNLPVKLKSFNHVLHEGLRRYPIYVLKQKNESFYFKLDEKVVKKWLVENKIADKDDFQGGEKLGANYLDNYVAFSNFLEEFKRDDKPTPLNIANAIYTLIHTYAHQMMHILAEYSGLDIGSLGEYIFPADCAFIIYRKGMTADLGNLSSTWRNHHLEIPRQILERHRHLCNSGTLCDERGGACPGCIMVPEVTCIAQNQLLSRSILSGGYFPHWCERKNEPMKGFFEISNGA